MIVRPTDHSTGVEVPSRTTRGATMMADLPVDLFHQLRDEPRYMSVALVTDLGSGAILQGCLRSAHPWLIIYTATRQKKRRHSGRLFRLARKP
jgi:hypothetical protein